MSYDIWLEIDTGGERPAQVTEYLNPTYNLAPMFADALGHGLRGLAGRTAGETIEALRAAIEAMEYQPERFKRLNPPNGWGSYEDALETLRRMLDGARHHPKARWHI